MMKRSLEKNLVRAVSDHPLNQSADFDAETTIEFAPRRMELEFDASVVTMIQELRDRGDLSRETVLNEFGFDQELEAARREYEDDRFPDVFEPTNVPFDSPAKTTPGGSGRKTPAAKKPAAKKSGGGES